MVNVGIVSRETRGTGQLLTFDKRGPPRLTQLNFRPYAYKLDKKLCN